MNPLDRLFTENVALPIHSWSVELTLEEDRPLPKLEEAILRLAQAGVQEFARFVQLLGVEERQIAQAFGALRLKAALGAQNGVYEVTAEGNRLLEKAAQRTLRNVRSRLWHDPYMDTLGWAEFDHNDMLTSAEQRDSGLRALPSPVELRQDDWHGRQRELQGLLDQTGLPEDPNEQGTPPSRYLVSVAPLGYTTMFLPVELEVLRNPQTGQLVYLLKRNGKADRATSLALAELAERNIDVVAIEPLRTLPLEAQRLIDQLITLGRKGEVPEAEKISDILSRAIPQAKKMITLMSSFHAGDRFDVSTLVTLRSYLLNSPDLHARIVLSGHADGNDPPAEVKQFLDQMQQLEGLHPRLEVRELPDIQVQGAIVDDKWGLIEMRRATAHPWKREYVVPYVETRFVNSRTDLQIFQGGM